MDNDTIEPQPQVATPPQKKNPKNKRKHANKSHHASKARRIKVIKGLIDGKPLKQIGLEAGFSESTATTKMSRIVSHPDTQKSFIRILEASGLDDAFLSSRLRQLADADGSHFFNVGGEIVEKHSPAHETRRKTLEMVCKLKGHMDKDRSDGDVNIALMSVVLNTIQTAATPK